MSVPMICEAYPLSMQKSLKSDLRSTWGAVLQRRYLNDCYRALGRMLTYRDSILTGIGGRTLESDIGKGQMGRRWSFAKAGFNSFDLPSTITQLSMLLLGIVIQD